MDRVSKGLDAGASETLRPWNGRLGPRGPGRAGGLRAGVAEVGRAAQAPELARAATLMRTGIAGVTVERRDARSPAAIAGPASPKMTKLQDRTVGTVTVAEIERILI